MESGEKICFLNMYLIEFQVNKFIFPKKSTVLAHSTFHLVAVVIFIDIFLKKFRSEGEFKTKFKKFNNDVINSADVGL